MVPVATRGAAEDGLRRARLGVDAAARAARLGAIGSRNLDEGTSRPCELVAKHLGKLGPSDVCNAARQVAFDHPHDVQFFQHDYAVALGESCRLDVEEVFALPPHLSVDASDADLGFFLILGSFLSPVDGTLSMSETSQGGFEVARVGDHVAVGRRPEVRDAAVDGDGGCISWRRIDLDFAGDRYEPLVAVSLEGTSLRFSLKRSMHDGAKHSKLRKADVVTVKTPNLRVRFTASDCVATFSFPARSLNELCKTALPSLIEFDKKLTANVTRNVGKPRQFSAQFGQLLLLVESGREDSLVTWSRKPHEPLFEREVPEKSKRVVPASEPSDLLLVGVDTEPKRLHDLHRLLRASKWIGCRDACNVAGSTCSSTTGGGAYMENLT